MKQDAEDPSTSLLDDAMVDKVKGIIGFHYDLELLQKRQELEFLKCEIARGESILDELKQLLYYDYLIRSGATLSTCAGASASEDYLAVLEDSPSPSVSSYTAPSPLSLQTHVKKMEHKVQYEMKSDGTFVKLVCPVCDKDKYGNILGLSNHCRIMHDLRFVTPEERIEKCGVPVSLEEIPPNYFVENEKIMHSEINLAQIRSASSSLSARRLEIQGPDSPTTLRHSASSDYMSSISYLSETRFYIRKRVIIGNLSKRIIQSDDRTSKAGPRFTHKWKMYLHGPPEDFAVESFIKKVRFFLHPSYEPNDVIDVVGPPFTLSNYAWGEFPIRLQVYFWDLKNPPKEFVHQIKFKKAKYISYTKSEETEYWIDLDKHTVFQSDPPKVDIKSRKAICSRETNRSTVQKPIDESAEYHCDTEGSDMAVRQHRKRSRSPSPLPFLLDSSKKKSGMVAHKPSEPVASVALGGAVALEPETACVKSLALSAPMPMHPRLLSSSLVSSVSRAMDRPCETAAELSTSSRTTSPLALSSMLGSLQGSALLHANTAASLLFKPVLFSREEHPVTESRFRDIMETAIPYYPLIRNDFVAKLLSDEGSHFYAVYPTLSYELAESAAAFAQWRPYKQKSVEWHRAKLLNLFCQRFFELERPLSTKRIVCWCRDHSYAPSDGNMHIQVPPTPQQAIRPAAERANEGSEDDHETEESVEPAKSSFSSEKELIASLEPVEGEVSRSASGTCCRYCGKPLLESGLASHYKRCTLKPIRMQLANLPTLALSRNSKALPPCTRDNHELWLSKMHRAAMARGLAVVDPLWMWSALLPLRLSCMPTHPHVWALLPTSTAMSKAVELFLRELVAHSIAQCRHATRLAPAQRLKCLTPVHIFMARSSAGEYFDFLFKE